jgi:hypothetical protein
MDIFDEFWLFVRKYLFSILLILAGISCLIVGASSNGGTDLTQSAYFIYGSIGLFILGFVSLFFILQHKISRGITAGLSLVFIFGSAFYLFLNVKTVEDRIIYLAQVEESKDLAKQGLKDIQKLQEAFDRKYRKFAGNFPELIHFAKNDSIKVLVKAEGDLPSRKMTVPEAKLLGYKYPKEVWTEVDALKLGLIIRDYAKIPVSEDLFSAVEQEKQNRLYPFSIDNLSLQRTIETDSSTKHFAFNTKLVDSTLHVEILSISPYGPQFDYDITEVYKLGGLDEKSMKSNWK